MTMSQGRHLNFTLHPIIQMSEQIVFRFTVLNFGTVYSKTLQIQHLSQYLQNDVLTLCIKTLKFLFIFSYYCNLCFFLSFFLFYFVLDICYVFSVFSLFISFFLLRIPTIQIYIYIDIFNCYVCNLVNIMFICTDFIEVDNWKDNIVNIGLW